MRFESAIEIVELEGELASLLPQRESLMGFSITVAPVINVEPVIVVGTAIAVQAGTIGSTVTASLTQMLNL
jgi:hypothetical protein